MFDTCTPASDLPESVASTPPIDEAPPDPFGVARQVRLALGIAETIAESAHSTRIDPIADVRRIETAERPAVTRDAARSVESSADFDGLERSAAREPRVLEIGGLAPRQARALASIGILSCAGLLQRAKTAAGRRQIAETTGADDETVRAWLGRAELLSIPGIDGKVLRLLEATGVHSALQLAMNRTELLFERLALVNVQERLLPTWPDVRRVAAWIRAARRDARIAPA